MNLQNSAHDHAEPLQTPDLGSRPDETLGRRARGHSSASRSSQQQSYPSSERGSSSATREHHRQRRRSRRNRNSSTTAQDSACPQPVAALREPSPPSQSGSPFENDGSYHRSPHSPARLMDYHGAGTREGAYEAPLDQSQLAMFAANNAAHGASMSLKDDLTLAAGKVTPGIDDTPYIQYALRALVGEQSHSSSRYHLSSGSSEPAERYSPPRGHVQQPAEYVPHLSRDYEPYESPSIATGAAAELPGSALPEQLPPTPQQPVWPSSATFDPEIIPSKRWVAVTKEMRRRTDPQNRTYQPLTFRPRILRTFSLGFLVLLCLLMTAALVFTVKYAQNRDGLTPYSGTIYSGQYFLFRILPQLLGSVIFLFAQCIAVTSLRVIPFTALASEDPEERYMAIFKELFQGTFLLPKWAGPWQFKVFSIGAWLALFTIPLQSTAFTCIWNGTKWMWAPVQDVVWALVGLYSILIVSTILLMTYWFKRWTGLLWDIRSIGDLLPLLNRSNGMTSYREGELAEAKGDLKVHLRERWFDRLGYWRTEDMVTGGVWYTLGVSHDDSDAKTQASLIRQSHGPKADGECATPLGSIDGVHGTYLPRALRDGPIFLLSSTTTLLFVALLVVSFLPQTRLDLGFRAGVTARPDKSDFSAANFIYSFVPSFVGVLLYLLLQGVDQALRIQQPWAGFYKAEGSPARECLMADYAACLPLQSSLRAGMNGHWRVALVSLVSVLSIFIPVLGGGFLMALTGSDGTVRMYPNKAVFGTLLALLAFYVVGLGLAVPFRRQLALPRPVTRIADMISLCAASDLVLDAAFRSVRSREDLKARLGIGRDDAREESRWYFGLVVGREEHRLSVRRMKRTSEKSARLVESMA